jgi:hypothetical protein
MIAIATSCSNSNNSNQQNTEGREMKKAQTDTLAFADIEAFLRMPVKEIISSTEMGIYNEGTLVIFEPSIFYPCIFLENSLFFIVCRSHDEEQKPLYVAPYYDSINDFIEMLNINIGMTFQDIADILGNAEIQVSKPSTDEAQFIRSNYKMEYEINGLNYTFCSSNKDGSLFELYISLLGE